MIKKVVVTLLVEVDTEDEHICPSGDPLLENCVLNVVDDRFFEDPVTVLGVSYLQTLLWVKLKENFVLTSRLIQINLKETTLLFYIT
mgnify:CR=1 FL=1